jgi:hypothetical protein
MIFPTGTTVGVAKSKPKRPMGIEIDIESEARDLIDWDEEPEENEGRPW